MFSLNSNWLGAQRFLLNLILHLFIPNNRFFPLLCVYVSESFLWIYVSAHSSFPLPLGVYVCSLGIELQSSSFHLLCSYLCCYVWSYSHQEIAADEDNVRKVSLYLTDVVIPKFIQDLCTLEVSPMDGQTLTEALHANGINVRYIGKVSSYVF